MVDVVLRCPPINVVIIPRCVRMPITKPPCDCRTVSVGEYRMDVGHVVPHTCAFLLCVCSCRNVVGSLFVQPKTIVCGDAGLPA